METIAGIIVIGFCVILGLFFGIPLIFKSWDIYLEFKTRNAGKKYCDENGLTFLKAVSLVHHTRLYFEKDGIESWANYVTDKRYDISWKKENPIEKLDRIKKKETTNPNNS